MDRQTLVYYLRRHLTRDQFQLLVDTGMPLTGPNGLRRWVAERDIEAYAKLYHADEFTLAIPPVHRRMFGWLQEVRDRAIDGAPGLKLARAIPRGHAKTTIHARIGVLHAALFGWSPLTLLIGNTQQAAERLLSNIRDELTTNDAILEDFGDVRGEVWQSGHIVANGSTIRAFGTGNGAIRGVSTPGQRPSLIIADDLDDDQLVRSPAQLQAAIEWWNKAVMQLGDNVTYRTTFIAVGTIIRRTSLLQHILDSPDFSTIIERGVLRYADNAELWERWREWYLEQARSGSAPLRPDDDDFYVDHQAEMLAGAQILWDRPNGYYQMMLYRLSRGSAAFASEVQNDPGAGDSHLGSARRITRALIGDEGSYELLAALDPTVKGGKSNDLAAFVEVLFDAFRRTLIVTHVDAKQRNYQRTVAEVVKRVTGRGRAYDGFWAESNTPIVADLLQERLSEAGSMVVVTKLHNSATKASRIELLAEYTERGQLLFADDIDPDAMRQYEEWPNTRFDDIIDAISMIVIELKKQGRLDLVPIQGFDHGLYQ